MARWWRWILMVLAVFGVNLCWVAGSANAQSSGPNLLVVTERTLKEYTLVAGGGAFTPSAAGAAAANLRITSTDPKAALGDVSLTAAGK